MNEKAKSYVKSLDLDYTAHFVPHSMSRYAGEQPCLNWRVRIAPKGRADLSIVTDYMQGIAHIPGYSQARSANMREACETGKYYKRDYKCDIPSPELLSVLACLVLDADVAADFEQWASDFGYDPDSRKAETIFRQCTETMQKLRLILNLDEAREAFEDY